MNQPVYAKQQSFAIPSGSAAPYRFQPGIIRSSREVQPARQHSRFARSIAILIPVATLLLLGFSLYAAAELGFINLPFINTLNQPNTQYIVPDLIGLPYQTAVKAANTAGFNLQAQNNITAGVVIKQSPSAYDKGPKGSFITVTMGQLTPTPTIAVPSHLVGNTLASRDSFYAFRYLHALP